MNKHTPGPWIWDGKVWDYDPEYQAPWLIEANDERILWGQIYCPTEANARLIASAPDLLEALEELMYARTDKAERMAEAAIAKARGNGDSY